MNTLIIKSSTTAEVSLHQNEIRITCHTTMLQGEYRYRESGKLTRLFHRCLDSFLQLPEFDQFIFIGSKTSINISNLAIKHGWIEKSGNFIIIHLTANKE
jgi:hypothetical protein